MEESRFYRFIKPVVPKPLRPLVLKYQELLSYLVFGALTTLVNLVIYYPLSHVIHYTIALVIAWIGAVIFAFIANKIFVFEDNRWNTRYLLRQAGSFALMRLLSLGMEELIMLVFVELLQWNPDITKLAAQVLVVILNYIFSKLIIFRKQQ